MSTPGDVWFRLEAGRLVEPTAEERVRLDARMAARRGRDDSDVPPLDEAFWEHAVRNPVGPDTVKRWTWLDKDLYAWLRAAAGPDWHERMNAVLREAMEHDEASGS